MSMLVCSRRSRNYRVNWTIPRIVRIANNNNYLVLSKCQVSLSEQEEAVCILQLEKMNLRNPQVTLSALKVGKTVPIYCWGGRREKIYGKRAK